MRIVTGRQEATQPPPGYGQAGFYLGLSMQPDPQHRTVLEPDQYHEPACPKCVAPLVPGMQYCRMCGYRLFGDAASMTPQYAQVPAQQWQPTATRRGPHWIVWVIISIITASIMGGGLFSKSKRSQETSPPGATKHVTTHHETAIGIQNPDDADGGVTFNSVSPPGSPADKAGLVGGDVITSFDGKPVTDNDELVDMIKSTPPGKSVDVIYLRDGMTKTTKLAPISQDDMDKLSEAYDEAPHGVIGIDDEELVTIPGLNIKGVKLVDVEENKPAYLAGLQSNDVIVEFDGVPIRTSDELTARVRRSLPLSEVKVVIYRGQERKELMIRVGKK